MDQAATRLINILLGNDETQAVIEMHFPAPQIFFEANTIFAIGGGDFMPHLDATQVENWRPIFARKGSSLRFKGKTSGNRAYLSVKGGLRIAEWLGSASTNLIAKSGGFNGRRLEPGDRIKLNQKLKKPADIHTPLISNSMIPFYSRFPTVRIVRGAEFEKLTKTSREGLQNQDFAISGSSDRMGFRLIGDQILIAKPMELVSSAVNFGTIQLLPDGQLIVLMADQQTAGGYPRIAHVISYDLPLLAQLGANDKVAFHMVETQDAEKLALDYEMELNFFRVGCKFHEML